MPLQAGVPLARAADDKPPCSDAHALELWKHFAASARVDQNTRMTTVSRLFAAEHGSNERLSDAVFLVYSTLSALAMIANRFFLVSFAVGGASLSAVSPEVSGSRQCPMSRDASGQPAMFRAACGAPATLDER